MKIRIKGNSVRIRLSKTEVETLAKQGNIEESTHFPNGAFLYSLKTKNDIDNLSAAITGSTITMYVPESAVADWATNEVVGFDHTLPLGDGDSLYLLLEKDFKCIDAAVTEDQSDNYENPLHTC